MHPTRQIPWLAAVAIFLFCTTATASTPPDAAHRELQAAIDAMGGVTALQHIQRVHLTAHGYRNMLEQSERPDGPWIPAFSQIDQWANFADDTLRTTTTDRHWRPPTRTFVADGVAISTRYPDTKKPTRGRDGAARCAGRRCAWHWVPNAFC